MSEKLCVFCKHFQWSKEEIWGMGSTQTGPMFSGGDALCDKGHGRDWVLPDDEEDWRRIIVTAINCKDYEQVKI